MTFRRRLSLVAALAVAVAVALASTIAWIVVRGQLRTEVDDALVERADIVKNVPLRVTPDEGQIPMPPIDPGERVVYVQVRTPTGRVITGTNAGGIVFAADVEKGPSFDDQRVDGVHFRTYSEPIGGFVLTLALPLTEVDESLRRLALILVLVAAGGIALAVVLGGGVTAAAAAPVARLTEAAERVTETGDLTLRIDGPSGGTDELGRLATSFNAMLGALESSVASQRRLVADASHELRTPITSIRTNVDLLASGAPLGPGERERMLGDVAAQLEELTAILSDLAELAHDGEREPVSTDVRVDRLVADAIERAERHARHVRFRLESEPTVVRGDPERLSRAIVNVLDNAAKWSPVEGEVDVSVRDASIVVRDRGPGFAPDDLPRVFDRFYRSAAARSAPGSGLGLAIVRQVVESHGGRAVAENHPDGGAIVRLELPAVAPT